MTFLYLLLAVVGAGLWLFAAARFRTELSRTSILEEGPLVETMRFEVPEPGRFTVSFVRPPLAGVRLNPGTKNRLLESKVTATVHHLQSGAELSVSRSTTAR